MQDAAVSAARAGRESQLAALNHQLVSIKQQPPAISVPTEVIDICDDDADLPRPTSTTSAIADAAQPSSAARGSAGTVSAAAGPVPSPACPTTPLGPSELLTHPSCLQCPSPGRSPRLSRTLVREDHSGVPPSVQTCSFSHEPGATLRQALLVGHQPAMGIMGSISAVAEFHVDFEICSSHFQLKAAPATRRKVCRAGLSSSAYL